MGYFFILIGIGLLSASVHFLLKENFSITSIMSLGSLVFFILGTKQIKKGRREKIKEFVGKKVDTMVTDRKIPMKRCPNPECSKEMKIHAVIVALHAKHSDSEIANFLNVSRQFVRKVRQELVQTNVDTSVVALRKSHERRSDSLRDDDFIENIQNIIDDNLGENIQSKQILLL